MGYRVVQWATGGMGSAVLKSLIDHQDIDLVGLYVYSDSKVGVDAGDIARRPQTGVIATNSVQDICELEADVVVHCARLAPPYGGHDDDIARLLEAGKNVISINGYSHPDAWPSARRARMQNACDKGGTTLVGAGLNPGFLAEQLAVVSSGVCQQLEHIDMVEFASVAKVQQAAYVFDVLGFGSDMQTLRLDDPNWGPVSSLKFYEEMLHGTAMRLGMELDGITPAHQAYAAAEDITIRAGVIASGTVSHLNWVWHGMRQGTPMLTLSIHWYAETTHLPLPSPPLWHVALTGRPSLKLAVELQRAADEQDRISAEQQAVAGSVLNTIPLVCAAAPGLLTRPVVSPWQHALTG